jgi:acetyl esterase/lipase
MFTIGTRSLPDRAAGGTFGATGRRRDNAPAGRMRPMPDAPGRDVFSALLQTRSALLADVDPDLEVGERLLVRSDLSGTMQLYELRAGELVGLTALPEPVSSARYIPRARRAVLAIDEGGNERHQLYLLELDDAAQAPVECLHRLENVTGDPLYGHHLAGVAHDGRSLAYVSNRGNGVDFDLWLYDLAAAEHRCLYAPGAYCQPGSGFSPDDRFVSVLRPGERPLDIDLVLVDVATGAAQVILEHQDEPALVDAPAWVDADTFYVSSNVGTDFAGIVRYELTSGTTTPLQGVDPRVDAEVVASANGQTIAVIENRNGANAIRVYSGADGTPGAEVALPEPGVVASYAIPRPQFSADGRRLYFTLSTPRLGGDVFAFDGDAGTRRLTTSPAGMAPEALVSAEVAAAPSFDGERIPLFVFRPPRGSAQRPPVVVVVHGGPEAQAMLWFNPVIQGLTCAGYAVVVPNVRGSTGYGKRYAALDDTTKRLDSVRDLAAVHSALDGLGCDPGRAILWGGSYGGYMVLAGVAFQPKLWAAGVDIVGISDLVTFLENTSEYRRAHREREYGSLEHDREFLAAASPLRRAEDIRAPLFVIHGRNDPRVPVSEAEQLVANLRERGIRCELAIYEDEGHGLARLANRLDAYPRAVAFLDEVLGR